MGGAGSLCTSQIQFSMTSEKHAHSQVNAPRSLSLSTPLLVPLYVCSCLFQTLLPFSLSSFFLAQAVSCLHLCPLILKALPLSGSCSVSSSLPPSASHSLPFLHVPLSLLLSPLPLALPCFSLSMGPSLTAHRSHRQRSPPDPVA